MKKLISTIIVIVMLLMTCGNLGVFADDSIMSAYVDIVNNLKNEGDWVPRYIIYDIDKDGIPELITERGIASESILYFYTFSNGEAKYLGEKRGAHASLASIPNENGIMRISAHSDFQHVTVISIVGSNIQETELMAKRFTLADYQAHNYEYYKPHEFYAGSVYLEFTDKYDLSGFGNFNYVAPDKVSTTLYETGTKKGIDYYNKGLYYEAINEIQWFCDANWYSMTAEQQQNALYYLNNSKSKLADYSFTTGKNYYTKGLYYEAQKEFSNALNLYPEYSSQWQSANDYLYNTNEKIKAWENRNAYTTNGSGNYSYYGGTNIPTYTSFTGRTVSETAIRQEGSQYLYQYPINYNDDSIINESNKYMTMIRSLGWENYSQKRSEYGISFYFKKNASMIGVNIDFKNYTVIISMIIK